jgi:transglutaminase-like putative cysteine protease
MSDQVRHWFDPLSIILLVVLLFFTGYCLESTGWLPDLNHVTVLILFGGILGLLLGQSRFSTKVSFWIGLILTFEFISWQLIFSVPANISWAEKSLMFFDRFSQAMDQVIRNQPLKDGVLFITGMSTLYWFIGMGAGFTLTRNGKPWVFISAGGLAIILVQLFQPPFLRNQILTALFCLLLIILLVRIRYLSIHQGWQATNLTEDQSIFPVAFRIAFFSALILILIAWNAPLAIKIATPGSKEQLDFREKTSDFWEAGRNFFSPLRQRAITDESEMGDFLALSASRSTRPDLLFSVKTTSPNQSGIQYYWRGRFFEKYQNGIWENGDTIEEIIPKDGVIQTFTTDSSENTRFLVTPSNNQFQVYFPSEPIMVDRDIILLKRAGQNEKEIIAIFPNRLLGKGEEYSIISSVRNYYLTNFSSLDVSNPKWMDDIYLQLPEIDLSNVRTLAKNITEGKNSAFEKVVAITHYLRSNFTYSDSVSDFPLAKRDLIEWFLFTKKSGFCTYFASAEVILLRTLGIPSRLTVGYSQGTLKNNGTEFEIHDKDNHAWPEVFFNNVGWVPFEPTPSQPNIDYEALQEEANRTEDENINSSPTFDIFAGGLARLNRWERALDEEIPTEQTEIKKSIGKLDTASYLLIIASLSILLILFTRKKIFKQITFPSYIGKQMNRMGFTTPKWMNEWDTYLQKTAIGKLFVHVNVILLFLGEKLNTSLSARQKSNMLIHSIPGSREDIQILIHQYEMEKYRDMTPNAKVAKSALRRIWIQAIKVRLNKKINSIIKGFTKPFPR